MTKTNVMALATGKSYNLVLNTNITAHPAVRPYPRWHPNYLIPIKKGGILENLYIVDAIIECLPEEIYKYQNILSEEQYKSLVTYHENRMESFGYAKSGTDYRFYILRRYASIEQPFERRWIQVSVKMDLEDIPFVR